MLHSRFLCISVAFALISCGCSERIDDPLPFANRRPTLLTYGLYVTPDPAQNPIDPPERFTGYHTAVDFEIVPGEEEIDVPVSAACGGKVIASEFAEGYGGVLVHTCVLDGKDVTVLYGHLAPSSLLPVGADVTKGTRLGVLAAARSADSDGNRKHLHFAIHEGKELHLLGYVQHPEELKGYLNPAEVFPDLFSGKTLAPPTATDGGASASR